MKLSEDDSRSSWLLCRVSLTGVLDQLGCDGDPAPLTTGNAPKAIVADQLVGHMAQTQFCHDFLHLQETPNAKMVIAVAAVLVHGWGDTSLWGCKGYFQIPYNQGAIKSGGTKSQVGLRITA